jgi:hypothetical protein
MTRKYRLSYAGVAKMLGSGPSEETSMLPWAAIAEGLLAGRIIPFLGAGASSFDRSIKGGCPPSGNDLLAALAAEAGLPIACGNQCLQSQQSSPPGAGAPLYQCTRPNYDLSRVASYYQLVKFSRPELDDRLASLTGNMHCEPNRLHHLLAHIGSYRPMLIVTTNYDALLERAFDEAGSAYEVVATAADRLAYRGMEDGSPEAPDDAGKIYYRLGGNAGFEAVNPRDLSPDLKSRSLIYKVHGSVPKGDSWPGGYLIAEEDYTRFLGRMDHDHIYPFKIKNIMRARKRLPNGRQALVNSLLFLGYSLNDWNLRVLMDELGVGQGAPGEERHHAILRSADAVAQALLDKRNITAWYADLNSFVTDLGKTLEALRPSKAPEPAAA